MKLEIIQLNGKISCFENVERYLLNEGTLEIVDGFSQETISNVSKLVVDDKTVYYLTYDENRIDYSEKINSLVLELYDTTDYKLRTKLIDDIRYYSNNHGLLDIKFLNTQKDVI